MYNPSFQVCSWLQGVKFWTDIQLYCLVIWPKDCWAKQCWWRLMYIFVCLQAVKNCNIKGFFSCRLETKYLLRLQIFSNCCGNFTKRWQSRVNGRENCEPSCQHWWQLARNSASLEIREKSGNKRKILLVSECLNGRRRWKIGLWE